MGGEKFLGVYFYGDRSDMNILNSHIQAVRFEGARITNSSNGLVSLLVTLTDHPVGPYVFNENTGSIECINADEALSMHSSLVREGYITGIECDYNSTKRLIELTLEKVEDVSQVGCMLFNIAQKYNASLEFISMDVENDEYYVYGDGKIVPYTYCIKDGDTFHKCETKTDVVNILKDHLKAYKYLTPFVSNADKLHNFDINSDEFQNLLEIINDYASSYDSDALFEVYNMRMTL